MDNKPENKQPEGWKDVVVNLDMPLPVLVNFLNVLNQRLVMIEDNTTIRDEDGSVMTITDFYKKEADKQAKEQAEKAAQAKITNQEIPQSHN